MALPVITSTTSILQYRQFQDWVYIPTADNDPTSWNCGPLAPGLTFDPATGTISGAALKPGVYNTALTATNSDGTSAALKFPICIAASSGEASIDSIDLNWDAESGLVTCPALAAGAALTLANGALAPIQPIASIKPGDVRMFHVVPSKAGTILPVVFTALALNLKEFDGDGIIATSVAFVQVGSGDNNLFRLVLDLSVAATLNRLLSACDDFYTDKGSNWVALAELTASYANDLSPTMDGAPGTLVTTSQDFGLLIQREINGQ